MTGTAVPRLQLFVAGLGNHYARYAKTRHNVGMQVLDAMVKHLNAQPGGNPSRSWRQTRWYDICPLNASDLEHLRSLRAQLELNPVHARHKTLLRSPTPAAPDLTDVYLIKPRSAMNVNGTGVSTAFHDFQIKLSPQAPVPVLLLHDDLDTATSTSRFKAGGSANGHNGVRSSIQKLRSDQFDRLRIGIGRPLNKLDVPDYVLEEWTDLEQSMVASSYVRYFVEVLEWIDSWPRTTTPRKNDQPPSPPPPKPKKKQTAAPPSPPNMPASSAMTSGIRLSSDVLLCILSRVDCAQTLLRCRLVSRQVNQLMLAYAHAVYAPHLPATLPPSTCTVDGANADPMRTVCHIIHQFRLYTSWQMGLGHRHAWQPASVNAVGERAPHVLTKADSDMECVLVLDFISEEESDHLPVRYSVNNGPLVATVDFFSEQPDEQAACYMSLGVLDIRTGRTVTTMYEREEVTDVVPFFSECPSLFAVMLAKQNCIQIHRFRPDAAQLAQQELEKPVLAHVATLGLPPGLVSTQTEVALSTNRMVLLDRNMEQPMHLMSLPGFQEHASTHTDTLWSHPFSFFADDAETASFGLQRPCEIYEVNIGSRLIAVSFGCESSRTFISVIDAVTARVVGRIEPRQAASLSDAELDIMSIAQTIMTPPQELLADFVLVNRGKSVSVYNVPRTPTVEDGELAHRGVLWDACAPVLQPLYQLDIPTLCLAPSLPIELPAGGWPSLLEEPCQDSSSPAATEVNIRGFGSSSRRRTVSVTVPPLLTTVSETSPPRIIFDMKVTPDGSSVVAGVTGGHLVKWDLWSGAAQVYRKGTSPAVRPGDHNDDDVARIVSGEKKGCFVWWKDADAATTCRSDMLEWTWCA
ncbi:hypothetical protein RI367_001514 [Sorochytrium milnesiophthora]